ncbi:MAG: SdpI family protein [Candidatus Aenigmarchaeota archaeon]|nr:SdpI family protein [Candidatus Aenigmarchaeota archaeon]
MKTQTIILTILLLSFAIGIYIYPQMPDKMASHWNAQGQVDGYMSKFWGVFLMPTISVGLLLLFLLIPKIDPLKANIEKFRKYYDDFIVMMIAFLFYVYLLTLVWNSGFVFNMTQFLTPASGLMFYYIGILTQNAKRNWFIGIRTPWTLSSENVWNKTHKIGGKLFKTIGIIAFLGIFFPNQMFFFVFFPVLFVAGYLIVYSYIEYQKEEKK